MIKQVTIKQAKEFARAVFGGKSREVWNYGKENHKEFTNGILTLTVLPVYGSEELPCPCGLLEIGGEGLIELRYRDGKVYIGEVERRHKRSEEPWREVFK